jgi:hypothetical protein
MPELPADFDLKLMPDWLKEPAGKNPYADYQGGDDDRRPRGRGGEDWGGGRGRQDDRRGKPSGPRRDDRGGARRDAPGGRKPDGKRPDRPAGRPDDRRGKPGDQPRRPDDRGAHEPREHQAPAAQPANVTIEFFPDESCSLSIARQIKSTHRAYSLFDLARMFLARPERHRLKITTKTVAEPLYQVGEEGPVTTDKTAAERAAFPVARQKYYEEVTEQRDMPKGNFSNVARCRANGMLLGPTNYHGYQPALRKLYEDRFSRRMSFSDFQREIEVVNDPALVEQWKQQASSVTVYRLKQSPKAPEPAPAPESTPATPAETQAETTPTEAEATPTETKAEAVPPETEAAAEPLPAEAPAEKASAEEAPAAPYDGPVFASLAEVEAHFREHHLPGLIRTASSFHMTGEASRAISDRAIAAAVRQAWEQERGFPGQMMHQLRQQFSRSGLHVFKHRKRMQFVSLIRPSPMEGGNLSPSVAEILQVIQGDQKCTRASLAATILGTDEAAVDQARKTTLATDLRWLIETGRVIEFSDGRLELPVVPAKNEPAAKAKPEAAPAAPEAAPAAAPEAAPEAEAPVAEAAPQAPAGEEPAIPAEAAGPDPEPVAISADSPGAES